MNVKVVAIVAVVALVAVAGSAYVILNDDEKFIGVIYKGNGGLDDKGGDDFRLTSGEVFENVFTCDNMVFTGWNTSADGSGDWYIPGDTISYPERGNVTLYAQWGYSMNITVSSSGISGFGVQFYLIDSRGTDTHLSFVPVALPSDGKAGILITAPTGAEWSFDKESGKFTIIYDGKKCVASVVLNGAEVVDSYLANTAGNILFTYDGPVNCTLITSYSRA